MEYSSVVSSMNKALDSTSKTGQKQGKIGGGTGEFNKARLVLCEEKLQGREP